MSQHTDSGIGVQFWLANTTMPPSVTENGWGELKTRHCNTALSVNWVTKKEFKYCTSQFSFHYNAAQCKLSYQERVQILHVWDFLETFAAAQCSLYSLASPRILGLIGIWRLARLCPNNRTRALHILSSGVQVTWTWGGSTSGDQRNMVIMNLPLAVLYNSWNIFC